MSGVRIPPPRPLIFDPVAMVEIERPKPFLVVAVAHQVEHRIVTPEVAGSRPVSHPTFCNQLFFEASCDDQGDPSHACKASRKVSA